MIVTTHVWWFIIDHGSQSMSDASPWWSHGVTQRCLWMTGSAIWPLNRLNLSGKVTKSYAMLCLLSIIHIYIYIHDFCFNMFPYLCWIFVLTCDFSPCHSIWHDLAGPASDGLDDVAGRDLLLGVRREGDPGYDAQLSHLSQPITVAVWIETSS